MLVFPASHNRLKTIETKVMANTSFVNDLKNVLKMDDSLCRGIAPRRHKKALDKSNSSINNSKLSLSQSLNNLSVQGKTPSKSRGRTPSKTPSSAGKKSANATPKQGAGGDRFIPMRSVSSFELGNYLINRSPNDVENDESTPRKENQALTEIIHGGDPTNMRILAFKKKAPAPPDGYINPLRVMYSQSKVPGSTKGSTRYIPQAPERVLDAPDIVDDYYLNLVDWSKTNIVAVALANCVFLWNAETGAIQELVELEVGDYICSVSWVQEGNHLAVGTYGGSTQIWDCVALKRLRTMNGHSARVGSLSWNQYILSSGSRRGQIIHHDVRQREHLLATLNGHTEEVCGLKWSQDGRYLASGGNDNLLNIWNATQGALTTEGTPAYQLTAHQAAVKALAWCPWQTGLLASGGGTADRCIRIWNANTGTCVSTTDTKSQVCALQWSANYKEIISGHGYANNQLTIWKYPGMTRVAELTGHMARVLHLCLSPDGSSVLSAGADETLRLWKCFAPDPAKKVEKVRKQEHSVLRHGLLR